MRKNTIRRNFVTIYLREKHKPIFEKFLELIEKDDEMKQLADRKNPRNIISVSIVNLMFQYNQRRAMELRKREVKNETPN